MVRSADWAERDDKRSQAECWSARSPHGMVATAHPLATQAGAEVLARGGNAFDAAACASFALAVCEPAGSGLGGMAMMLAHDARCRRTFVIEGACRAPIAATPALVAAAPRSYGYRAVAVPTLVAVLRHALAAYGSWTPAALLEPAIQIATEGYPLSRLQHRKLVEHLEPSRQGPAAELLLDHGRPPAVGTVWRQPVLAATLTRLARHGLDDFYEGDIAREIVADMRDRGGFISAVDLASSQLCREAVPLHCAVGDCVVYSAGPPAGGAALLQMLGLLSAMPDDVDPDTAEGAVITAEIIRQARVDRRRFRLGTSARGLGAAAELLTPAYATDTAQQIRARLDRPITPPPAASAAPALDGETSHLSVMDRHGNVVTLTQSIERSFGAAVATPGLGFLYNGYLRAFKVKNRRHPHYLRPGMPARSNAAPTIVFRDGLPAVAIGSTGSERMASSIFQVLMRLRRQAPFDAVHAPRLHATPDGRVLIEADRYPRECLEALSRHRFIVEALEPYAFAMGGLQMAVRDGETFVGVGDPRREGAAAGPAA